MIDRRSLTLAAALVALFPLALMAQKPSARDAFWSASDLISVTPNPAAHKRAASHSRSHPASAQQSADQPSGGDRQVAAEEQERPGPAKAVQLVSENGYGAAPHIVRTAADRLGLRCSVLLRGLDGRYVEVAPGSVFHSGDHIRLSLLANEPGYVYVIEQGSSGAWSPVFPPSNSPQDANRIAAGQLQMVPGGTQAFAFDQNPGNEKLYIILSRSPIEDIDRAIQGLKGNQPAPPQNADGSGTALVAENKIPDFFVQQLASRDLTLVDEQKVDDSSSAAGAGEKAIYVVSKTSGPGSGEVVLHLVLHHE